MMSPVSFLILLIWTFCLFFFSSHQTNWLKDYLFHSSQILAFAFNDLLYFVFLVCILLISILIFIIPFFCLFWVLLAFLFPVSLGRN